MSHNIKFLLVMTIFWSFEVFSQSSSTSCLKDTESEQYQIGLGCPVGEGLWGQPPSSSQSHFWVQCGVFSALPEATVLDMIASNVMQQQVIFNQESTHYRCLLGPYQEYEQAVDERDSIRAIPKFSSAFLRELDTTQALPRASIKQTQKSSPAKKEKAEDAPILVNEQRDSKRAYHQLLGVMGPIPLSYERQSQERSLPWLRASYR